MLLRKNPKTFLPILLPKIFWDISAYKFIYFHKLFLWFTVFLPYYFFSLTKNTMKELIEWESNFQFEFIVLYYLKYIWKHLENFVSCSKFISVLTEVYLSNKYYRILSFVYLVSVWPLSYYFKLLLSYVMSNNLMLFMYLYFYYLGFLKDSNDGF